MGQISLQAVCRTYTTGTTKQKVLNKVDLQISDGNFSVVCGPSGSGKSTLLNIIGTLDAPDDGTVMIEGVDVRTLSENKLAQFRNKNIGFIFQNFHLLPVLTAAENVAWPLYFKGVRRRERMRIAKEKLGLVGLANHVNKLPKHLSGGERQRVAIARALVCEPSIILADEPTANLDRKTARKILEVMKKLNEHHQVTFLCATHDNLVVEYAKQLITLADGKLTTEATTKAEAKEAS